MSIEEIRQRNEYFERIMLEVAPVTSHTAEEILFRCSSLHHLMTDPKPEAVKRGELISEGTKTHLVDIYTSNTYNRHEDITSKFLEKGNEVEDDSITIISRITKTFLRKNEQHLKNYFIMGTPDLFIGEDIHKAEVIRDAKSSWSVFTFMRAKHKPLEKSYYWQMQGYMALTGAKVAYVDYCLNNTPYSLVENELRKLSFKYDGNTPAWIELQLIANHVYDLEAFNTYMRNRDININALTGIDFERANAVFMGFVEIALKDRHFNFKVDRNDADIDRLYKRIEDCREWIKNNLS